MQNAWNVPACGNTATLTIAGLKSALPGSFLWNPDFGYFEIQSVNPITGQLVVKNTCIDGNATAGTAVPSCSGFIITGNPVASGGGGGDPTLFPYVAIDFTAPPPCPDVGCCINITVTTVNGLATGKDVQIGTGVYTVDAILGAETITICNNGSGITPGTSVIAKDEAGQYQYPIVLIDSNICTNAEVESGTILVCKDGIASPLTGGIEDAVPVLIDAATGEVEFQLLDIPPRTCTVLSASLTLVPAQAAYTLVVQDSSDFSIGDVLQLGNRSDRLTITNIPDGTHIQGTLDPVPGAFEEIAIGTPVCLQACCETLAEDVSNLRIGSDTDTQISAAPGTLSSVNLSVVVTSPLITVDNNSLTHTMYGLYSINTAVRGFVENTVANRLVLGIVVELSTDGGAYTAIIEQYKTIGVGTDDSVPYDFQNSVSVWFQIPANTATTYQARLNVVWAAGAGLSQAGSTYLVNVATVNINAAGSALPP